MSPKSCDLFESIAIANSSKYTKWFGSGNFLIFKNMTRVESGQRKISSRVVTTLSLSELQPFHCLREYLIIITSELTTGIHRIVDRGVTVSSLQFCTMCSLHLQLCKANYFVLITTVITWNSVYSPLQIFLISVHLFMKSSLLALNAAPLFQQTKRALCLLSLYATLF